MIELFEDRPQLIEFSKGSRVKGVFVHKGRYNLVRAVPGLGWLVDVGTYRKLPQRTIVRFSKGKQV
jgi:hypothetical protein